MALQGRVCVITGAARGIGRAYAQRFAAEGAVVGVADVDGAGAERTAKELGGSAFAVQVDISSLESCRAAAAAVLERAGQVDCLVNNAALYADIDMNNHTEDYLQHVLDVNMLGAWRMSKAVVPAMIERGYGRIVNQGSGAAYSYLLSRPPDELPSFAYAWSKWGINGLTKFMAGALGRHGITVNCITPGPTATEATKQAVSEKLMQRLLAASALGRVLEPEDLAGPAVFLCSDDAAAVTGQIICVDGGMNMPA